MQGNRLAGACVRMFLYYLLKNCPRAYIPPFTLLTHLTLTKKQRVASVVRFNSGVNALHKGQFGAIVSYVRNVARETLLDARRGHTNNGERGARCDHKFVFSCSWLGGSYG